MPNKVTAQANSNSYFNGYRSFRQRLKLKLDKRRPTKCPAGIDPKVKIVSLWLSPGVRASATLTATMELWRGAGRGSGAGVVATRLPLRPRSLAGAVSDRSKEYT